MTDTPVLPLVTATLSETMKVKGRDGTSIGAVYALMVHKRSGRALYAVLSLGGFLGLGLGRGYYAVPIQLLTYDLAADQYVAAIDPKALEGGPSWASTAPAFDQGYADRLASYYGAEKQDLLIG